jgi:hypothetical protein
MTVEHQKGLRYPSQKARCEGPGTFSEQFGRAQVLGMNVASPLVTIPGHAHRSMSSLNKLLGCPRLSVSASVVCSGHPQSAAGP